MQITKNQWDPEPKVEWINQITWEQHNNGTETNEEHEIKVESIIQQIDGTAIPNN